MALRSTSPPPLRMILYGEGGTGKSLFNLYISPSRSFGHEIRLLWDFNDEMFLQAHEPKLIEEDERLEQMDLATKAWWERMQAE